MPMETITTNEQTARQPTDANEVAGFYWRERDGIRALICGSLEADGFANAFSTRLGGVSPMPDNCLNLAGFNEDVAENIYENRRRFLKLFEGDWTISGCWQVHGTDVRTIDSAADAAPKPGVLGDEQYCDALVSNTPRVLLAVKTADCVPILLGDPVTRSFAAVHAGWRGTSSSIVTVAIENLQRKYGSRPADLRVAIGPAANACCYEIGGDVISIFQSRFADADQLLTPTRDGHARINLHAANRTQLIKSGVLSERIHTAPYCTMDRNDLFFSYRREKRLHGRVGRLMAVIGRD